MLQVACVLTAELLVLSMRFVLAGRRFATLKTGSRILLQLELFRVYKDKLIFYSPALFQDRGEI